MTESNLHGDRLIIIKVFNPGKNSLTGILVYFSNITKKTQKEFSLYMQMNKQFWLEWHMYIFNTEMNYQARMWCPKALLKYLDRKLCDQYRKLCEWSAFSSAKHVRNQRGRVLTFILLASSVWLSWFHHHRHTLYSNSFAYRNRHE